VLIFNPPCGISSCLVITMKVVLVNRATLRIHRTAAPLPSSGERRFALGERLRVARIVCRSRIAQEGGDVDALRRELHDSDPEPTLCPVVHQLACLEDVLDEIPKLRDTPHSVFSPRNDVVDCDYASRSN
jgi:hypothetical protein